MTNQKLISFDLKAEFGFLKKPDINDGLYLTYNMLHKPALLGLLGAIAGMRGYQENRVFPDYYNQLKYLKIGICPLNDDKGNFTKTIVSYNNSTGLATNEIGGNLIVKEQILIKPSYRCFLLLNLDNKNEEILYENVMSYKAEFLPYLGKNDFSVWWTNAKDEYSLMKFDFDTDYKISSVFEKTEAVSGHIVKSMSMKEGVEPIWIYFERLPIGFDENLYQYQYGDFVYSNAKFSKDMNMSEIGVFYRIDNDNIVQLF